MEKSHQENKDNIEVLVSMLSRQEKQIKNMSENVQDAGKSMRANLVLYNIPEAVGENCVETVQDFFQNTMKITETISIDTVNRIDIGVTRPMVVRLTDPTQKMMYLQ